MKRFLKFLRRSWYLILLGAIFIHSRSERYSFRYDRQELDIRLQTYFQPSEFAFKRIEGGLHFLQIGDDPSKPYVVFIHGSPGSLWDCGDYLTDSMLFAAFNLISIDRQGFGLSDYGRAERSLQVQANQLYDILKTCRNQDIYLVGHSFGGPIQAKAAMMYPNLIRGLVMVAPSISAAHEPANGWRKIVNFPLLRWFTPPALKVCNQEIIPLKQELLQLEKGWSEVKVPVTIIQGTSDRLVPKENALFAKKAMGQNSQVKLVMLENANHFIFWSEKDLIRDEILTLIDSAN